MDSIMGFLVLGGVLLFALYQYLSGGGSSPGGDESAGAAPKKVSRWERYAKKYGRAAGIPWQIIMAVIWKESAGNPNAVGSAGEYGLMQLKPGAVEDVQKFTDVSTENWMDSPEANIRVGTNYLKTNLMAGRADGNIKEALRMYNQGPTGAFTGGGVIKSINYAEDVINKAVKLGYDL